LVREFFGDPGEYEITLDVIAEDTLEVAGTLAYSQTVTGRLEAGKRVGWTFMGEADDVVDIILTPGREDRDLVIVLVDPAGDAVITADTTLVGFPERLIGYRLPVGGRWMILIKEFFNDGSDYTLTLTRQSSPRALIRVEE